MKQIRSPTYVQYSKRLCGAITVFWCALRLASLAAAIFRPELGASLAAILQGADDVMICNVAMYCGNSVAEKGILSYFGARKPPTTVDSANNAEQSITIQNG